MNNVAFLGTGLLGSAMVERMLAQGDRVTVWNRTASKAQALESFGAKVAATPGEAVASADRVHMCLSDDAIVDTVIAKFVPKLRPGAVVLDHTTASPAGTVGRYARAAYAGFQFLHAPVFMSPQMAREGKGLVMVGGDEAVVAAVHPVLARMSGDVWYVGRRPDLAAAYKLMGNSLIFVINTGIADVLAIGKNLGIAPEEAIAVFGKFNVGAAVPMRAHKMARGDFSATFELTMARKDTRLAIEAAGAQPLAVLPAVAARMDEAIADGHGKDDLVAIAAKVVSARV